MKAHTHKKKTRKKKNETGIIYLQTALREIGQFCLDHIVNDFSSIFCIVKIYNKVFSCMPEHFAKLRIEFDIVESIHTHTHKYTRTQTLDL